MIRANVVNPKYESTGLAVLKITKITGFIPFLIVVFLNAFVDLGHKIVIQNTVFTTLDGNAQILLSAAVNAMILLPFIFLFTPSGYLADKYPKNKVICISAIAAVIITLAITVCYAQGWFWSAFILTLVLAMQSALYSPAKYGYIRELVGSKLLARGNSAVQALTTVAILSGIFIFSILFEYFLGEVSNLNASEVIRQLVPLGWLLVAASVIEVMLTYTLPIKQHKADKLHFDWQAYASGRYLKNNLNSVLHHSIIWRSIIGLSLFWAVAQVLIAVFPAYAKEQLEITSAVTIQGLLACTGIGIVIGSLIAGRVSQNYIEIGLIPVGAIGIAIALSLLPTFDSTFTIAVDFVAIGTMAGCLIVPLNSLIQFHARQDERGTVMASSNLVQNVIMVSFLVVTVALCIE